MIKALNMVIILQLTAIWFLGLILSSMSPVKMRHETMKSYESGYESGYVCGYSHGLEKKPMNMGKRGITKDYDLFVAVLFGLPICEWLVISVAFRLMDRKHTVWWHLTDGWVEFLFKE